MSTALKRSPLAEISIDQLMMPVLEPMGFWARAVHEVMAEVNPQRLKELAESGALKSFLIMQQEQLQKEARELERSWKLNNPLPNEATFQARASWINQAKLSAREILMEEIRLSLELPAQD